MMDILMSETCWAHKKWNKIASDIKLVFYSSTFIWSFLQNYVFFKFHFGGGGAAPLPFPLPLGAPVVTFVL